jgi:hypothetical protein
MTQALGVDPVKKRKQFENIPVNSEYRTNFVGFLIEENVCQ